MINKLTVHNVKCFTSAEFSFAPLTLFCGPNSAGKSTAIQCLLLLRQSYDHQSLRFSQVQLVGELFSVGHVRDLLSFKPTDSTLSISIDDLKFHANARDIDRESYTLPIEPIEIKHDFFSNNLIYLCAERIGPRSSYDISFDTSRVNLGIYGQFSMSVFSKNALFPAENQTLAQFYSKDPGESGEIQKPVTLEICVKTVMRQIFGEFDIKAQIHDTMDRVSNTFSTDKSSFHVRPSNTGFGISSTFPIIVGAFCSSIGDTIIVENPEVHLHPQAQSELAKFLGAVARTGRQVIIETHSDHILNGFRLSSKLHKTPATEVTINSITKEENDRLIKTIRIDEDGNLSDLDNGFFDQIQKDLLELF